MPQYCKKPVVIEAVQFTGDVGATEITALDLGIGRDHPDYDYLEIATLEGTMRAVPGDWIIRGVGGELYPCKDSIFRQTYDPVMSDPVVTVNPSATRDPKATARAVVDALADHVDHAAVGGRAH